MSKSHRSSYLSNLAPALRPIAMAFAKGPHSTKAKLREEIRVVPRCERDGLSIVAAMQACIESAEQAREIDFIKIRIQRRFGYDPAYVCENSQVPALLPSGTPAQRRARKVSALVVNLFRENYNCPGRGNGSVRGMLTDSPQVVGVAVSQEVDRNTYRGDFKGWCHLTSDVRVAVPLQWNSRVNRHGLAVIDGLMTLDASRIEGAPQGVDLYAAVWVEQGRGYSYKTMSGFIAKAGAWAFHADTMEKALRGLKRKVSEADWHAEMQTANLADWVTKAPPSTVVRVADAKAIGACDYGIRSWCNRVGLDYESSQATLAEVYAAYLTVPQTEARAAILQAIRRHGKKTMQTIG